MDDVWMSQALIRPSTQYPAQFTSQDPVSGLVHQSGSSIRSSSLVRIQYPVQFTSQEPASGLDHQSGSSIRLYSLFRIQYPVQFTCQDPVSCPVRIKYPAWITSENPVSVKSGWNNDRTIIRIYGRIYNGPYRNGSCEIREVSSRPHRNLTDIPFSVTANWLRFYVKESNWLGIDRILNDRARISRRIIDF